MTAPNLEDGNDEKVPHDENTQPIHLTEEERKKLEDVLVLEGVIHRLLDRVTKFDTIEDGEKALVLIKELEELMNKERITSDYVSSLLKLEGSDPQSNALLLLSIYLWLFEGAYVPLVVDSMCLLLTANKHDLFDPIKSKYAISMKDIGRVATEIKFKFLQHHNCGFILRTSDQKIRNKIAHQDFTLGKNGEVRMIIDGKEKSIPIGNMTVDLKIFTFQVSSAFTRWFESYLKKDQQVKISK